MESIKKSFEYWHGYSDGYKEGFSKALQEFQKELELARMSRPIEIVLEKESF